MQVIRIGKILGFEVNIDWSWLLIFALVVWTLANGYFPTMYPQFGLAATWLMGLLAALMLFVSVVIHELSHSLVARYYGTKVKGITLFMFGGISQTEDEPKSAVEEFWMAIAGPATSLGLALFFYMVGGTAVLFGWPGPAVAIFGYLGMINLMLGLFNLAPGFPLDGGRILRSIIWATTHDLAQATRYASSVGQFFGYLMMAVGLVRIAGMGDLIGGLWLIFVGWFLTGAARTSYQQLLARQALSGTRVEQIMTTDVPVISSDMTVREFVNDRLLKHEYSCYPVVRAYDESVLGVVGAEEVRKVPSQEWETKTVGEIATPLDGSTQVSKDEDAWQALAKLASNDVCRLFVMDNGRLVGTVGREAMFRLVQIKTQLGV